MISSSRSELHAAVLDALPDSVLVSDVAGRVVLANAAALRMLGWQKN